MFIVVIVNSVVDIKIVWVILYDVYVEVKYFFVIILMICRVIYNGCMIRFMLKFDEVSLKRRILEGECKEGVF